MLYINLSAYYVILDAAAGSWSLEIHNGLSVGLGHLYIVNLNVSSMAGKFLINADVNIIISSYMDLQEV